MDLKRYRGMSRGEDRYFTLLAELQCIEAARNSTLTQEDTPTGNKPNSTVEVTRELIVEESQSSLNQSDSFVAGPNAVCSGLRGC